MSKYILNLSPRELTIRFCVRRLDREEEENRRARLTKDFVIEERVEDSQSIEAQRAEEIRLREEEEQ